MSYLLVSYHLLFSHKNMPIDPPISGDPPVGTLPLIPPAKPGRTLRNHASHNLIRQHSTSLQPSHHKQYVILRDKPQQQQLTSGPTSPLVETSGSPQLKPQTSHNSLVFSGKVRPYIKKQPSAKYLFSVDDNEDEIEDDLNQEYLEGYSDGLRQRIKLPAPQSEDPKRKGLESEIVANLSNVSKDLKTLKELNGDTETNYFTENVSLPDLNESSNIIDNDNECDNYECDNNNDDNDNDNASINSVDSFTLRERQVAINETHPFGIRIWKPAIYKKDRSVQREAENDIHCTPGTSRKIGLSVKFANLIWILTFGLFLSIICGLTGSFTFIFSIWFNPRNNDSLKYAKFYWSLGKYLFNPFGTLVILKSDKRYMDEDANVGSSVDEFERWRSDSQGRLFFSSTLNQVTSEESRANSFQQNHNDDDDDSNVTFYRKRFFGRGQWNIGRVIFYIQFYLIIYPISSVIALSMWLGVFTIPMAKVLTIVYSHIRRHPLALAFENEEHYYKTHISNNTAASKNDSFLILTYRSFGFHYYKYTVDGTNIFFINLISLVIFTIVDFYLLKESLHWQLLITDSTFIFCLCLVSVIPLAYFIGQAVASISAQTSMGVGAVINAFFSTIVEVYLYCIALDQSKAKLVEGSIIGSILCGVLLLPGGSMCFGAIKRKTQRYNPASAGVSSTMLLFSIFVMLAPSILYQIYGEYNVVCSPCIGEDQSKDCNKCHYFQPSIAIDTLYVNYLRPFSIICAVGLFLCYCICLLFTLKTHAALIWSTPVNEKKQQQQVKQPVPVLSSGEDQSISSNIDSRKFQRPNLQTQSSINILQPNQNQPIESNEGGHDAPNWSRTKSTTILLISTLLYAIIAEILVDCVDVVLVNFNVNPKLLGLTIFALVPNTTEFVNAFSFAMHGNVALSMEIGSAYALQVCLLQIPIVTLYSTWKFTSQYYSSGQQQYIIPNLPTLTSGFGLLSSNSLNTVSISKIVGDKIDVGKMFPLIFPHWDFMASLIGVYMFTYIYTEGKSNYFKGSILLTLYVVLLIGFYFALQIMDNNYINYSL